MSMTPWLAAAAAFAAAPFLCAVAEAEVASQWSLGVEALALKRSDTGSGAIVAANPGGTPFLSGGDLDYGISPGAAVTVAYTGLANGSIEGRLMYSAMDGTQTFTSPGSFIGVGFTGPGGVIFASEFETTLTSGEINWRHSYSDRLSVLVGLRALDIGDSLRTVLNASVVTGEYAAENSLLGAQIGAQMSILDGAKPFKLSISGKVGTYSNRSSAGTRAFVGSTLISEYQSEGKEQSLAAEVGLKATYQLSERSMLTAGYQMLWVSDLALASSAASESLLNPSLLDTNMYRDDLTLQAISLNWTMGF